MQAARGISQIPVHTGSAGVELSKLAQKLKNPANQFTLLNVGEWAQAPNHSRSL